MGNRKQPFGYKMEKGQIVPHAKEAEVVEHIFRQYLAGASFDSLASELREQPVHYDVDKPWNKNMVARILEDNRYAGDKGYPVLIPQESLDAAARKRCSKQNFTPKTETQKILRRLSGCTADENMERKTLRMLNRLISHPEEIQAPEETPTQPLDALHLQNELEKIMSVQPIDEAKAKEIILSIASGQYAALGSAEYETERLKWIFGYAKPMIELDALLLLSTVSAIQVHGDKSISLRLKNNQIIREGEEK